MKLTIFLLFVYFGLLNGQQVDTSSLEYQTDPDLVASARSVPSRSSSSNNRLSSSSSSSTNEQTMALYPNALDASWYSASLLRMHYLISQLRSPILPYAYLTGVQLQRWLLAQFVQLTREQLLPRMTQFSAGLLSRNCELLSNQLLDQLKAIVATLQPGPQHRTPDL